MIRNLLHSKYFKASFVYVVISVLPSAINFLLLPLYLQHISVEDYGYLIMINFYGMTYNVFACLQINIAASTQYFNHDIDRNVFRVSIMITTIMGVVVSFLLFAVTGDLFFSLYKNSISFYPLGLVVITSIALSQLQSIIFLFLKNEYRVRELGIYTLASVVINVTSQIIFVVYLDMGINGIVYGGLIPRLIIVPSLMFIYSNWVIGKDITMLFSKKVRVYAWNALKLSLPFLPTVLLHRLQTFGDRFVLERFVSLEKVGQYAVLITLLGIPNLVVHSILTAIRPKILALLEDKSMDSVRLLEFAYLGVISIIFLFTLLLGANLQWFTDNPKYLEVRNYLFVGILAAIPGTMLHFSHLTLMHASKTGWISKFSLLSFLVQLALLISLTPTLGLWGALIAMAVAGLVNYGLNFKASNQVSGMKMETQTLSPILTLFITISLGIALTWLSGNILFSSMAIFILGILLIFVIFRKKIAPLSDLLMDEFK